MKLSNEEIQKHISELPENIKQAVIRFDWAGEVMDIARTHGIQIDEIDLFRQETLKVILGISPADDFEENVRGVLGVSKDVSAKLVEEANERIFVELQKRAFADDPDESVEDDNINVGDDPYLEPIEHHEVKNVMKDEGVHLLDHDEPVTPAPLGKSLEDEGTKPEPQVVNKPENSYREPIEESDMRGIKVHNIDTSIVKKQDQQKPASILENTDDPQQLGTVEKNQTLEQEIMSTSFTPQQDLVEVSSEVGEGVEETDSFLQKLSEEKEV